MEKTKARLKSFSVIYIILAVLYAIATILCLVVPDIADKLRLGIGSDIKTVLVSTGIVTVLLNLWYFWLARRVVDGKSKGTFYMILLLLGIIGSIVTFITSKSLGAALTFDALVDIFGLYFLYQVMKYNK